LHLLQTKLYGYHKHSISGMTASSLARCPQPSLEETLAPLSKEVINDAFLKPKFRQIAARIKGQPVNISHILQSSMVWIKQRFQNSRLPVICCSSRSWISEFILPSQVPLLFQAFDTVWRNIWYSIFVSWSIAQRRHENTTNFSFSWYCKQKGAVCGLLSGFWQFGSVHSVLLYTFVWYSLFF